MKRSTIFIVGVYLITALTVIGLAFPNPEEETVSPKMFAIAASVNVDEIGPFTITELLIGVNKVRAEAGISALVIDERLSKSATLKARHMIQDHYFGHYSPSGIDPWYWFEILGVQYKFAGENLAKCYATVGQVIQAWVQSPEHLKNIVQSRYNYAGFGMAQDDKGCIYVVNHFAEL